MEKRDARLFQQDPCWNIVELESRRSLHRKIDEIIGLACASTLTTAEMRQLLLQGVATSGNSFATQLVRSLHRDNQAERQSIVWLLTLLDAKETISPLRQMTLNKRLPRPIRLSAALALSGMGETAEIRAEPRSRRLYAIG
jgi:hypothetical protein